MRQFDPPAVFSLVFRRLRVQLMKDAASGFENYLFSTSPPFTLPQHDPKERLTMTGANRPDARATLITLSIFLLITSVAWAQTVEILQQGPPNLTGRWILNTKASDDIGAVIREAMGGGQGMGDGGMRGGGKGGGKGGGGGGRGGAGGRGGGMGGSGEEAQNREVRAQQKMVRVQEEYSQMEIFHDGIELNVTNGLDISRLLFTDGRQMTIWTQNGEARATASWRERTLVVQWKTSQDTMSRIRNYTLSQDGRQLTMTENRRLPGQDKTVKFTMVYDLEE